MNLPVAISLSLFAAGIGVIAAPSILEQAAERIHVTDGDTVRRDGIVYRLVGLDAPETGPRARCASERAAGNTAKARLQELIATRHAELVPVPCACRPGTAGTKDCNWGRSCAVLTVDRIDVATIMIGEGLAREYRCGATSCPKRQGWCSK